MLVPRSRADIDLGQGISPLSVNAMAFAGCVLVKDEEQLRVLREKGTEGSLELLKTVTFAPSDQPEEDL